MHGLMLCLMGFHLDKQQEGGKKDAWVGLGSSPLWGLSPLQTLLQ